MAMIREPASHPCGSCPYRRDVPSGVWSEEEYRKLPLWDGPTWNQPPTVFMCHQADGRVCAGWAGCHDMSEAMGPRIAMLSGKMSEDVYNALLDYVCSVELWGSGAEACAHGMAEVFTPGEAARRVIAKLSPRLP
jgi:hypothetical protein